MLIKDIDNRNITFVKIPPKLSELQFMGYLKENG